MARPGIHVVLAALALPALGGCLATRPPAPPVRWFDPTPRPRDEVEELVLPVVTADPRVRQEFVLRVAPRELVIDEAHRWIAAPERLVAAALAREIGAGAGGASSAAVGAATPAVRVHVQRFELVLFETPHAVVELLVTAPAGVRPCVGTARALDTTPEALADAMAQALAAAAATCRELFVRP